MKKEEMTKIVNTELKILMPHGLNEEQQKLWRFTFNMWRRQDLALDNPMGGIFIADECLRKLKEIHPKSFSS